MKIVAQARSAALVVATAGANVGQAATINLNSAVLTGGALSSRTINPIRFSSSKSSIRGSIWVGLGRGEQRN